MKDLFYTKCSLRAEIEGLGELPVVKFEATFSLNQIPGGRVMIPLGRDASTGEEPSAAYEIVSQLKTLAPIKVYFQAEGEFDADHDWPEEEALVFDGKISGTGYLRGQGQVSLILELVHWLVDLDFSSALSAQSHVANPTNFTRQAILGTLGDSGLTGSPGAGGVTSKNTQAVAAAQSALAESVNIASVQKDLWGEALKPFLCAMASLPHAELTGELSACAGLAAGKNDQAQTALGRIEGEGVLAEAFDVGSGFCNSTRSVYTPPLSLLTGDALSPSIAGAIAEAITGEQMDSFAHTTLWGKLLNYAAEFSFAVVPQVSKALVVPFVGGLRALYCKQIRVDDYDRGQQMSALKRPVRAVAIAGGVNMKTNVLQSSPAAHQLLGLGGCYSPDDADENGMIFITSAPRWMQKVFRTGYIPSRTTGLKGQKPINTATTPVASDQDIKDTKNGESKEDLLRGSSELYNGYAHAVYLNEALRGRGGWVSGKLRFDIAPGSNVLIEGARERHLGESDKLSQTLIGQVVRTTVAIDAQSSAARTDFQVAWTRSEAENKSDQTSVELHPLYRTKFLGAPLVDSLLLSDDQCAAE